MLTLLRKLIAPAPRPMPTLVTAPSGAGTSANTAPGYLAKPNAYPNVPPAELLQAQAPLIRRLDTALEMPDAAFKRYVVPVLERYAAYVHLLPASQSHHHCDPGGLLRHGCEAAFYAARLTQGMVFAMETTPSVRRRLEPRYRAATAFGGLLHDLGKAFVDLGVTDVAGEKEWNYAAEPLHDWLVRNQLAEYRIFWRPGERHGRHELFGTGIANQILGAQTLEWLGQAGMEVVHHWFGFLAGGNSLTNPIVDPIAKADGMSVEADQERMKNELASSNATAQGRLAVTLLRAINKVVQQQTVHPNEAGQLVFYGEAGAFAKFPEILKEAGDYVRKTSDRGVPTSESDIARILLDAKFIQPFTSSMMLTSSSWDIAVDLPNGNVLAIQAIKFDRPEFLFGDVPLPQKIGIRTGSQAKTSTAQAPAPATTAASAPATPSVEQPTPVAETTTAVAAALPVIENRRESDTEAPRRSWNEDQQRSVTVLASDDDVDEWLDRQPKAGTFLKLLADRVTLGQSVQWGRDIDIEHGKVLAIFPDVLAGMGVEPREVLELFQQARWIEQDPASPERLTVSGSIGKRTRNALRFNGEASQAFLLMAPPGKVIPAPASPSPARAAPAPIESQPVPPQPAAAAPASPLGPNKAVTGDRAYLRVVAYNYLRQRFHKVSDFADLSPQALKQALGALVDEYLSPQIEPDEWWEILLDSPYPLLEKTGANRYRFKADFAPAKFDQPMDFYKRYPTLLNIKG